MKKHFKPAVCVLIITLMATLASIGRAITDSGNDLCRNWKYEADKTYQKKIRAEALGKLFYFRYLRIVAMEEGVAPQGYDYYKISTLEPSSDMYVEFTVVKPVSLQVLRDNAVQIGDAIGVTGRIATFDEDPEGDGIFLEPVIVKHKDKLEPVKGKELMYELDPNGRYYTYTGAGKDNIVIITGRDRDLVPTLDERIELTKQLGAEGFAKYLNDKLAARQKERDEAKAKMTPEEYAKWLRERLEQRESTWEQREIEAFSGKKLHR